MIPQANPVPPTVVGPEEATKCRSPCFCVDCLFEWQYSRHFHHFGQLGSTQIGPLAVIGPFLILALQPLRSIYLFVRSLSPLPPFSSAPLTPRRTSIMLLLFYL